MNLAPLRETLLASVRGEIDAQQRQDEAEASARLAQARAQAAAEVSQARLEGERAAAAEAARVRAAALLGAREAQLRARSELIDELQRQALAAVLELRQRPEYGTLLDQLSALAREQLGQQAEIVRDPADVGGIIARSGQRSVDYTLPVLLARELEGMGEEVEGLWQ